MVSSQVRASTVAPSDRKRYWEKYFSIDDVCREFYVSLGYCPVSKVGLGLVSESDVIEGRHKDKIFELTLFVSISTLGCVRISFPGNPT